MGNQGNYTTEIHSNGSGAVKPIATLLEILSVWQLDESLAPYISQAGDMVQFFGNFRRLSHVFRITTDDPGLIERLTTAIKDNNSIQYDPVDAFLVSHVSGGMYRGAGRHSG